jgi:hypothetical protein
MKQRHKILEALFPYGRAEVLRLLFRTPQKEYYVRELMGMSGVTLRTIQDELRKLRALELVKSRSNRYHRFYRANCSHALYRALNQIVEASENSPSVAHRALYRLRRKQAQRKKPRHLPSDRAIHWDLFSKSRET